MPRRSKSFAPGANIGVFDDRWQWIEQRMLPRWQVLADQQPARVERRLQVRMIGGPPFLMPVMLTGKLGQEHLAGDRAWQPQRRLGASAGAQQLEDL